MRFPGSISYLLKMGSFFIALTLASGTFPKMTFCSTVNLIDPSPYLAAPTSHQTQLCTRDKPVTYCRSHSPTWQLQLPLQLLLNMHSNPVTLGSGFH